MGVNMRWKFALVIALVLLLVPIAFADYNTDNVLFNVNFKNNSNSLNAVTFTSQGYNISFDISTSQLHWYNSTLGAIIGMQGEMNPQNNNISIFDNMVMYPNAWVNTDLQYQIFANGLKETLIIWNVSKPSSSIHPDYLQYVANIKFNNSLQICNATNCYLHPTNQKINSTEIYFKDENNITIASFPKAYATDSNGAYTDAFYSVVASNGIAVVNIRIPKEFIDNVVYPMFFDPQIIVPSSQVYSGAYINGTTIEGVNSIHLNITTAPPYDNLILYMPFDVENSSAKITYDYSNYSNDGTLTSATWNSNCIYGGCYNYNPDIPSKITLPVGSKSLNFSGQSAITVMAWINTNSVAAEQGIWNTGSSGNAQYTIRIGSTGKPSLTITTTGSGAEQPNSVNANKPVVKNQWSHVAITYNGSEVRFYLNGTLDVMNASITGLINGTYTGVVIGTYPTHNLMVH
jgi:hypothetical protein